MDRRTLLKLGAASLLAGVPGASLCGQGLRVVVAGAGIVGASIAYHLAKSGVDVTVVDQLRPASHASRGTFAWVNATWAKQPRHYHRLNQQGLATWKTLQDELGIPARWGGSLEWFADPASQAELAEKIREQADWGEPARMAGPSELRDLEPNVDFGNIDTAAYSPNDGAIDPVAATTRLLDAARTYGASVIYPSEVVGVDVSAAGLSAVITTQGRLSADKLVLATGAAWEAGAHLAGIHIPQESTPGIIVISKPTRRLLNRIVVAPGVHLHQRDDGRIVFGEQGGPPGNEAHVLRLEGRPNDFPAGEIGRQHAARILATAQRFVPEIANAEIEDIYIGWRPLPLDGHPVIGPSPVRPDVYFAIMHSGVSLAPIVGQLAAHEIISEETVSRLEHYRPGREFENIKRY